MSLKDKGGMEIEEMPLKLCSKCFCTFFVIGGACAHCGSLESETFWTDDDGDCLFKLVSDKRPLRLVEVQSG